ncbi:MAG TPA: ATP-binding protein [Candidatus Saccharimonadia bacterium]|nr:ATP-binding protein [Candidatus Saccharimonadia bacterium]
MTHARQDAPPFVKKKAHERGAEAEAIFTSIGDGAISTDEFGRITRVNPTAQQLLGYSEKELVGQWFPKIVRAVTIDDRSVNLIDRPITKAFLAGKPISENLFYLTKNGSKIPVAITCSPIIVNGKPLGAIEVFRDITFEHEVDRMKSEFISLASHQLRTPLSAIKTYTHMLSDGYMGDLNDAQKKSLETIIGAANRMNELISTLLNITRIESGTIAISRKLLQIDKLANEVARELELMASGKSIKLLVAVKGKGSTTIKTDALIVKEVLINLVSNAIKYTPDDGDVSIIVRPRRADILVEVHDSGWGIPKISQDQIFTKFFRAQNIVRRETTGTGLGLYLVKGLLDALDGRIWFVSHEDKGTSFFFTLPRAKRPARLSE